MDKKKISYGRTDANAPVNASWYIAVITDIWLLSSATTHTYAHAHLHLDGAFVQYSFSMSGFFSIIFFKLQNELWMSSLRKWQLHMLNSRFTNNHFIIVSCLCDCVREKCDFSIEAPSEFDNIFFKLSFYTTKKKQNDEHRKNSTLKLLIHVKFMSWNFGWHIAVTCLEFIELN